MGNDVQQKSLPGVKVGIVNQVPKETGEDPNADSQSYNQNTVFNNSRLGSKESSTDRQRCQKTAKNITGLTELLQREKTKRLKSIFKTVDDLVVDH